MLYGHIENYAHRVDHMNRLRELQDQTAGLILLPLKFRNHDNEMSDVAGFAHEDMKVYAMARIFLDNFPHIKAYWPMLGRNNAQLSLSFGVNDIDGTIDDSTKIYSMAGSEEQRPAITTEQLVTLINQVKRRPIERDTLYHEVKDYSMEGV
jgi:aminodeoxyfutalosine synthase